MTREEGLKNLIFEIENSNLQKVKCNLQDETFELKPHAWLIANLSGNYGALYIRAILHKLNIDEHHLFKWRLENKFKQYQVLNYYFPGCMPETVSFSELYNGNNGVQKIRELFSKGFFLKATLGDATRATNTWDKTTEFEAISKLHNITKDENERYMLQRKLHLKHEFRVHTFSKDIIPAMTYTVQGLKQTVKLLNVEKFINEVLERLPDVIIVGTLIAWDIALTDEGKYYIIEANFTGFHPEYRKGFQTTGYVDNHRYGAIICAWLNIYFYKKYGIYVDAVEDSLFTNYPFYKAFVHYMSIFKNEHINLHIKRTNDPFQVIIYLGEDTNKLIVHLIKHFLLVDFATKYYVISMNQCFTKVDDLFCTNDQVEVWAESWFLTTPQLQLIQQLSYDRRKTMVCYHALRRFKDKLCVII